jgi:hypothetical protein
MTCSMVNVKTSRIALLVLAILVCSTSLNAQVLYGTLLGNVTDPSGAAVGSAVVRLVNKGTGQSNQVTVNDSGIYTFQNVPAGSYDLTVTSPGFSSYTVEGIELNVNTVERHDVTLKVGQVSETVKVEATAVALQTDRGDISVEIPTSVITELPLPRYRNFQSLINLVPGATPARFQNANTDSPQRSLATNVNGTTREANSTRIDGTLTMQLQLRHAMYLPGSETIEVVNITTDAADAEQGLSGGSAVTVQTKSGTNQLHGSLFEHNTSNLFAARDFFFKGDRAPKNITNIFGGTVGGPIKKDKLFFFAGYEAKRERTNFGLLYTLPTADQRRGDFSAYPNANIYDPLSGNADGTNRTRFANNVIPADRLNPISLKFQNLIPATNLPGLINNYFNSSTDITNNFQIDTKVNYAKSANHMMFLKWGFGSFNIRGIGGLGAAQGQCLCTGGATGDGAGITKINTSTFGQTKTITPNFVYDMAIGWSREGQTVAQTLRGVNYARDVLGIPGTNGDQLNQSGHIRMDINGGYSGLGNFDNWMPAERHEMVFNMVHNFSWIKGSHNIRFGTEMIHNRLIHFQPGPATQGNAFFQDGETRLNAPGAPGATQFNNWAAYLLGFVEHWEKGLQWEQKYAVDWQFGLYIRDRWQINQKLTFSYGLRWEKYPMMHRLGAHHPGIENWDPTTDLVSMGGNGNNPSGLGIGTSNRLFTPRVGLAYRVKENLVIRTGYGINIVPTAFLGFSNAQWPASITGRFEAPNSFSYFGTWQTGIPPIVAPAAGVASAKSDPRANITYFPGDTVRRTYIQSWNFTLEQRLPGDVVASAGYVGTQQTHLRTSIEQNYALPGGGTAGRIFNKLWGATANRAYSDGFTSSNYHALQLALNKRAANGLTLKGGYTWGHALGMFSESGGEVTFVAPEIRRRNYTNALNDVRHTLQMGFVYDLPFGRGKKMLTSGIASKVLGDWQFNGIFAAYTGRPFDITSSATACNCPSLAGTFTGDLINSNVVKIGSPDQWFDKSAFAPVTRRTGTFADLGNMNRRALFGPGIVNLDAGLFKELPLTERWRAQFRAEVFNLANTPHFNPPDGNASNATFMVISSSYGSRFAQDQGNRLFRFAVRVTF